jgi:eukaryotic-like serine/threonine-protein kinase
MEHLQEQTILDFVAGALDDARTAAAHQHVDGCAACRQLVAEIARGAAPPPAGEPAELEHDTALDEAIRGPRAARPPLERIDEYELRDLLGRGGMGSVWLAHDTRLDREVAIKLIGVGVASGLRDRLLVEARAAARIRHPNVVTVHRVGEASGQPYIVYELVRGRSLRELALPVPWPKVLALAVGIARGLAAVHASGVLHRDIKPGNIMLAETGDVVLVDFGLAKLGADAAALPASADPELADGSITMAGTMTGTRMGTPRYMAPEAWRGQASPRSDLYSLGAVLYELCAGRTPHPARSLEELARRVVAEEAPLLAEVAPWIAPPLADAVQRCVRRDPLDRVPSADALREALEAIQLGRAFDEIDRIRSRRPPPQGNPYRGRLPYGGEDRALFFGRRDETRALLERLQRSPFVLVVGGAGVGKTSLCRAGVLPLVMDGALGGTRRWTALSLTPGRDPVASLCAALAPHLDPPFADPVATAEADPDAVVDRIARGHGQCSAHIVFVDQMEELVTVSHPDRARIASRLLAGLARPAASLRLLGAVAAEHLIQVAALPGLDGAVGPAPFLLLEPRSEAALREIIVGPARLAGVERPAALVDALAGPASRGETSLGGLSEQLTRLWK